MPDAPLNWSSLAWRSELFSAGASKSLDEIALADPNFCCATVLVGAGGAPRAAAAVPRPAPVPTALTPDGLEKKSPPELSVTWPSLPRCTELAGGSSTMLSYEKREPAFAAGAAAAGATPAVMAGGGGGGEASSEGAWSNSASSTFSDLFTMPSLPTFFGAGFLAPI
eukprot:105045-Chlamydomonas_euryale.AAC.1